jgi:lactoylglutathione lyase
MNRPSSGGIVKPKFHSVAIFVKDIEISKSFYKIVLDLDVEMDMGLNVILQNGITLWQIDPNHMIPKTIGLDKITKKGNGFELYFETDDINNITQRIKVDQIPMVHELIEEQWGQRTIRIFDPDGNIIEFGETLECFLRRLADNGLNIGQIAVKTGMKEQDIEKCLKT